MGKTFETGYTCFTYNGCTVVDYFIGSQQNVFRFSDFHILKDLNFISDHVPVRVILNVKHDRVNWKKPVTAQRESETVDQDEVLGCVRATYENRLADLEIGDGNATMHVFREVMSVASKMLKSRKTNRFIAQVDPETSANNISFLKK